LPVELFSLDKLQSGCNVAWLSATKVEHVFAVMKLKFGFVKLRFRGLKKNATQLFAVCALVNLYLARKKLLILAPA